MSEEEKIKSYEFILAQSEQYLTQCHIQLNNIIDTLNKTRQFNTEQAKNFYEAVRQYSDFKNFAENIIEYIKKENS